MTGTPLETQVRMATTAFAGKYDISRDPACYCVVEREDSENYYGSWVTGMGFFDVRFPKTTTREMTETEKQWLDDNEHRFTIGNWETAMSQAEPMR